MKITEPSWWGKPEYNGIKLLVLVAVLFFAGKFVYDGMQQNSLGGKAQLVASSGTGVPTGAGSSTTGAGLNNGKGGNPGGPGDGGTKDYCNGDRGGVGLAPSMNVSADNSSYSGGPLYFDNNYQDGGHFRVENTSQCPIVVTSMIFSMNAPAYPFGPTDWTPVGGVYDPSTSTNGTIKLHVGNTTTTIPAVPLGSTTTTATIQQPNGPLFGLPLLKPMPLLGLPRVLKFDGSITIPALSYQDFALEVSSWNTHPKGSAASPANISFSIRKVFTNNTFGMLPNPYVWVFATSGATLPMVTSAPMLITMP